MPVVDGKHYDYSPKGIAMAQAAAKKKGVKLQYKKKDSKMKKKGNKKSAKRMQTGGAAQQQRQAMLGPPPPPPGSGRMPQTGNVREQQQALSAMMADLRIPQPPAQGGGRKGKLKGAPRPGGRKAGGSVTQGMRNTVKVPPPKRAAASSTSTSGLSKIQLSMLKQAQKMARDTGQNPKALQDLVAKYGSQLKGGGRKGKAKGAPRPGGRRNGGEVMAPPTPTARRTRAPAAGAGLSQAQQNLLRGAQQHSRSTGQNPQALQNLTAQHGQLLKPREGRRAMLPGAPTPGGMKRGGKVGYKSPGNSGLYGRK